MADPQLPAHHVRISQVNEDRMNYLKDLSGVIVVLHTEASRDHLHIYWRHPKPITKKTFIKHLKEIKAFSTLNGQKEFMVSDPGTIESYWKYTMSGRKDGKFIVWDDYSKDGAKCLYWNHSTERIPDYPLRPNLVIATPEDVPKTEIKVAKDPDEKKKKFLKYCQEYFQENPQKEISEFKITKLLLHYSKGGFKKYTAPEFVNYVMYNLLMLAGEGKKEKFKDFESRWISGILKIL